MLSVAQCSQEFPPDCNRSATTEWQQLDRLQSTRKLRKPQILNPDLPCHKVVEHRLKKRLQHLFS